MILHPLFHWAPAARRERITEQGLRVRSRPTCSAQAYPYICCCLSPSQAWALSAGTFPERARRWDCWQIVLDAHDSVVVLPFQGNRLEEIRIQNTITVDRLWLVGSRAIEQVTKQPPSGATVRSIKEAAG